jgi:LCP family protein required for cell wall assembly
MRVLKIFGVLFVLLVAGLLVFLAPALPVLARWIAWPAAPSKPVTVLVAGVSPEYSGYHQKAPERFRGLTDTMILVQLNPQQDSLKLLSLPRDTRVNLEGWGWSKLNSALARVGPEGMVGEVEELTGTTVDGYLLVSLQAARDIVDALGGIDVHVPERMVYNDEAADLHIDLKEGPAHLNGEQAEGFLRFRHDGRGDIGRVQRQQAFFRALVAKLRQPGTILKIPSIARVIDERTRTNLDRRHSGAAAGFLLSRPRTDTLLLPGDFGYWGGVSYWVPDEDGIAAMSHAHLKSTIGARARDAKELSIGVVNVGGIKGAAAAVVKRLQEAGFRGASIQDLKGGDPDRTVVLSPGNLEEARQVAKALGGKPEARVSGEGVLWTDLTVFVGKDMPPAGQ